jgi:plasmid stabilization system protein ParE
VTGARRKRPEILWTLRAKEDLLGITGFIARDAPETARRWGTRLVKAVEDAAERPFAGRMVPEFGRENLREVLLKKYRIVYAVREGGITVVSLFEGHRLLRAETPESFP